MLKNWVILLLAAALLVGVASAEETSDNGQNEAAMKKYESAARFSLMYPEALLTPVMKFENDAFVPVGENDESEIYLMIVPTDISVEQADALLDEAGGGYDEEHIRTVRAPFFTKTGAAIRSVELLFEGKIERYYVVCGEKDVLCVTVSFPVDTTEDYGEIYDAILTEIQFAGE